MARPQKVTQDKMVHHVTIAILRNWTLYRIGNQFITLPRVDNDKPQKTRKILAEIHARRILTANRFALKN